MVIVFVQLLTCLSMLYMGYCIGRIHNREQVNDLIECIEEMSLEITALRIVSNDLKKL